VTTKSVYWPEPDIREGLARVAGDEHRHLKVSRTGKGERVELFDGAGRVWTGEVARIERAVTEVRVLGERLEPGPVAELILGQALIRNAAFERVLEKAVEVGVTRIVPFRAARSNDGGQGRTERWHRIVVEAAKQSRHYHLPSLDPVTDLAGVLSIRAGSRLVLAEQREGRLNAAVGDRPVLYLVGPEGGWTDGELDAAGASGFHLVRLGRHIMRAETAAIAGAVLILHELGELSS
jgi:16S rRNA (uracil1498-N3)-methyltransferase